MTNSDELKSILDRIADDRFTEADIATLRRLLGSGDRQIELQLGKYNVNIGEGREIHIGDRFYYEWNDEAIQALVKAIQKVNWRCVASLTNNDYTQVENQSTGIGFIDNLAVKLTNFSQQSVMRYGLKLAYSPTREREYFISGGHQALKRWQPKTWRMLQEIHVSGIVDLWLTSVAISPDGQLIAACKAYEIQIWQLGKEKAI